MFSLYNYFISAGQTREEIAQEQELREMIYTEGFFSTLPEGQAAAGERYRYTKLPDGKDETILSDLELPTAPEFLFTETDENSPVFITRAAVGNDDVIAYMSIPGTAISYPVAQSSDNEYYLHHDLLRRQSSSGTIFLDYVVSSSFSDRSSILYGHNMRNGTKFHNLRYFLESSFFENNRYINVVSTNSLLQYEIFAAFTTHISFNYIKVDFPTDVDFMTLVNDIKERSYHISDIVVRESDRMLILSTCFGGLGTNYRIVIVGVLINEY